MFKKLSIYLLTTLLMSLCFYHNITAENDYLDMSNYRFKMLTFYADQDNKVVISKYTNPNSYDCFCLQPKVGFDFNAKDYEKIQNDDETIFNIVRAYHEINNNNNNDNYYIAAQIMIWEHLYNLKYTFNGESYDSYIEELEDKINNFNDENKTTELSFEKYINEEFEINGDFSKYQVIGEGIEVIENDASHLSLKITNVYPLEKEIKLINDKKLIDDSYQYHSSSSQDIYVNESDYQLEPDYLLHLKTKIPEKIDICYAKVDKANMPIAGAEFILYEINELSYDEELILAQINYDLDLFKILNIDKQNYVLSVSKRYEIYLKDNIINTNEIGYFDYTFKNEEDCERKGRVYILDDKQLTNETYKRYKVKIKRQSISSSNEINIIQDVETGSNYLLCESEPAKGYVYDNNPCVYVDANLYQNEIFKFINDTRTYSLKVTKQDPYDVLLDGAKFKISYLEDDKLKTIYLTTGKLSIVQENNYKYLFYKNEDDLLVNRVEFKDAIYELDNAKTGKYYYYQSNDLDCDENLLKDVTYVLHGCFKIDNLPYSSKVIIQEIEAPRGYQIDEQVLTLIPNLKYSEVVFKNYRINEFYIKPKDYDFVKTCIEG